MKADDFIPGSPSGGSEQYLNMKALDKYPDKTVRVRIMLVPFLTGWEWWTTSKKPIRRADGDSFPSNETYQLGSDGQPTRPHRFWATVVWNVTESKLQVFAYSQGSVTKAIRGLVEDSDWGNPLGYDLKIRRSGSGMETEYSVVPCPKSDAPVDVRKEWEAVKAGWSGLEALFAGGNPFDTPPGVMKQHDRYEFPGDDAPPPNDNDLPF